MTKSCSRRWTCYQKGERKNQQQIVTMVLLDNKLWIMMIITFQFDVACTSDSLNEEKKCFSLPKIFESSSVTKSEKRWCAYTLLYFHLISDISWPTDCYTLLFIMNYIDNILLHSIIISYNENVWFPFIWNKWIICRPLAKTNSIAFAISLMMIVKSSSKGREIALFLWIFYLYLPLITNTLK